MSKESLEFHIKSGDYFGTLATALSLVRQNILNDREIKKAYIKILENLEKDLVYLQKEYKIARK